MIYEWLSGQNSELTNRDLIKLRKLRLRKEKLREKFVKRAEKFMSDFEQVQTSLKENLENNEVDQVALAFGVSPTTPKEVFLIQMPKNVSKSNQNSRQINRRRILTLFRTLTGNDELFHQISQELTLTNIYIGLKMSSENYPNFKVPTY